MGIMVNASDPAWLVLSMMDLPFVKSVRYPTDPRSGDVAGYACALQGVQNKYKNWCHETDPMENGHYIDCYINDDPSFLDHFCDPPALFHRTAADAWACFDTNHPGIREAIQYVEAVLRGRNV